MGEVETLLLYCTKAKPYLYPHFNNLYFTKNKDFGNIKLNGKIVVECDFEVEKIRKGWGCLNGTRYFRNNVNHYYPDWELEKQSCLSFDEINNYLKGTLNENCGYAIHIKNLHVFDSPLELSKFLYEDDTDGHYGVWTVERAPKNGTVICTDCKDIGGVYCCRGTYGRFLALSPEEMCRVLKGEQTVVIRKTFIKGAEDNEG